MRALTTDWLSLWKVGNTLWVTKLLSNLSEAPKAENDAVGQELQKQLEAAVKELKQVQELFSQAADNCLNLKKPD
ncbi:mediator of RNA polymerase II transcription subunit 21 isoform X2 [Gossypium hirsutum]|uniref:Mediator of RNA polymerase II transcription subunit 21 isoform X2 n=1 Tax=Gossypium hirsutum TaxID=3635 RepID=A0ABM2ZUB6_GOSHI|nr:mediator of RNA polymerase II transcription subunit 21-like isoform X2 [Gossypium hirsutum]